MNKKGFTLIEVIVVVVIIGLLIVFMIPNLSNIDNRQKEKALTNKIAGIETAAASWAIDHQVDPSWIRNTKCNTNESDGTKLVDCDKITIKVQRLVDDKYYSAEESGKIENPVTKADMRNNNIIVEKKYNQYYGIFQK